MKDWHFTDSKFLFGAGCIVLILLLAAFGGWLVPYDAQRQSLLDSLLPPFSISGHPLGTDQLGRDILARMVLGARISLLIATVVVVISGAIGIVVGSLSGYLGGTRDLVIQKVVETVWAFPAILLAIAVLTLFGQTLMNLVLALTLQRWIPYARLARAQTMTLRGREFVSASKIMGGRTPWILRHHIIPNLFASSIVIATFSMATAIIAEASLSFLGMGVPPSTPTWGGMLAEGRSYITSAWWLAVFPGLGIFITVLGLNLLGDWLRDQFDPKDDLNLV